MDFSSEPFCIETRELLKKLEQDLVTLEENPRDEELLNRIFRNVHTMKGSGSMFGFENISEQAHVMESVFDSLRSGALQVTKEIIDASFEGLDRIEVMLDDPDCRADTGRWRDILDLLPSRTEEQPPLAEAAGGSASPDSSRGGALQDGSGRPGLEKQDQRKRKKGPLTVFHIRLRPKESALQSGNSVIPLFRELAELGELLIFANDRRLPAWKELKPTHCYIDFDILLSSTAVKETVEEVFIFIAAHSAVEVTPVAFVEEGDDPPRLGEILQRRCNLSEEHVEKLLEEQKKNKRLGELAIEKGYARESDVAVSLEAQNFFKDQHKKHQQKVQSSSLMVPDHKINSAVNLVGELVTLKERLLRRASELKDPALNTIAENLNFLTGDLREGIMEMRLVPLQDTFVSFRRLVRDISQDMGKKVDLQVEGGDTELDKNVIDVLKSSLVHMIRNSVDHGIESPEERVAAGKSPVGEILLRAQYVGSQVQIEVCDDGRGINLEKVRKKAVERGVLPPEAELKMEEVLSILAAPGFSTADQVSSVSGRGVGTDAVLTEVERLSGQLFLESEQGRGSTFTIRLPLTLAIIDSLLVRLDRKFFTIHLNDVKECFILRDAPALLGQGQQVINHEGHPLPLVNLRRHMKMGGDVPDIANVVVVDSGSQRAGIVVDQIMGQSQVVIKPLNGAVRTVPEISGSTILGDGSISFILDVPRMITGLYAPR
ncbi:two-component system, chemotaxis family, sensor kinase CheA [Alkalispirochaeta americana]|uniref:Chemotaxis protein CheA n=1 Tax=Alkalispirochaeta americana TaxID=159291 RepID=A0A1N6N732_9SPIO|nr:chemotaxis protein CheA [Alkalispirochaeta americana]SIP87855.1 two-component system, chemotaxis family, sensor kinase CheA [Alkalispirochaeta americana]